MTRTTTALSLATLFAVTATLAAQPPSTTTASPQPQTAAAATASSKEISVSGCLARGTSGGFMLTNARVEPPQSASTTTAPDAPTPPTAGAGAATAGAVGTTGVTPATTEPAGSGTVAPGPASASTWTLSGGSDL